MTSKPFEFEFHEWLEKSALPATELVVGIGDDAAVWDWPSGLLVVTTDTLCDGVHFRTELQPLEAIGRKALAVSLSDIAAMGARPVAALVSLVLPNSFSLHEAARLTKGLKELADQYKVSLIGGDTNRWPQGLVIGTTVFGRCQNPWRLSGAKAGDLLITTGSFGGSIHGHHLDFTPRCEIANRLAETYIINAATDVSDSFLIDLQAICEASNVGAVVGRKNFPISEVCLSSYSDQRVALDHALTDGEDFELLLAIAPDVWTAINQDEFLRGALQRIGEFTSEPGIFLSDDDGSRSELKVAGYEH